MSKIREIYTYAWISKTECLKKQSITHLQDKKL